MTSDYHTSPDYTGAALWDNGVFSKALGEDFTPTGITTAPSDDTRYKYYVIGTKKPDPDAPAPDPPAPAESGTRLKLKCKDSDDFVTKTLPIGSALGITTDGFAFTSAYSELSAASAAPAFHEWVNGNDEDITSKFFPHDGVVFNGLIAQAGNGMLGGSIAVTDPVTGKTKNDAALISNVEVRTVAHGDT